MKKTAIILMLFLLSFFCHQMGHAQIIDPAKRATQKSESRVNRNIDKGIDKSLDGVEKGIGNIFKKKDKKDKTEPKSDNKTKVTETKETTVKNTDTSVDQQEKAGLVWAKYDFIPGEKVIFEDNQMGEENGEFPSRWDLHEGNVEIAEFAGEKVIMYRAVSKIIPFLKNPLQDYLPETFSLEFDGYYFENTNYQNYTIYFQDSKNQKTSGIDPVQVYWNQIKQGKSQSWYPDANQSSFCKTEGWYHISLLFNKRAMKVYLNDTRLINVPNISENPTGITIYASYNGNEKGGGMIKNIRIAEAGQKLYDKFLQDGKIISNGIRFDVNKATLRPESMGIINGIAEIMKDHPEINFSIEGHTDSDGDDALNQTLSEKRAATVAGILIDLGIAKSRLTSTGWGETKPIDNNTTPEGRANNRRVEFVKM